MPNGLNKKDTHTHKTEDKITHRLERFLKKKEEGEGEGTHLKNLF